MTRGVSAPYVIKDRLVEVSPLERIELLPPLTFGAESEAILGGPKRWRDSLRSVWRAQPVPAVERTPRWIHHSDLKGRAVHLGDWALCGSLYMKLTRPKNAAYISDSLMSRPRKQRHNVAAWLLEASPLCALLEPTQGAPLLAKVTSGGVAPLLTHTLGLFSAGLSAHWSALIRAERIGPVELSADAWSILYSLALINEWAATLSCYLLGEACISAIDEALAELTPEQLYHVTASSVEELTLIRQRRRWICDVEAPWRATFEDAQSSLYGDDGYLNAQLSLRYLGRWQDRFARLALLERHGARLTSPRSTP